MGGFDCLGWELNGGSFYILYYKHANGNLESVVHLIYPEHFKLLLLCCFWKICLQSLSWKVTGITVEKNITRRGTQGVALLTGVRDPGTNYIALHFPLSIVTT
ncbi:Leupaxin [Manis pentadactyla]|nr:Leupaxin [Manis pentadactyla]